jgi:hypothetical protein
MNWFLCLGDDQQILYNIEKPKFTFRKDKKTFNKLPTWTPICIEVPTRPLDTIVSWMKDKKERDIILQYANRETITESWLLQKATISSCTKRVSRILNSEILAIVLKYKWARKIT